MAFTTAGSNTELIKYGRDIFARGYAREDRMVKYQGKSINSIIRLVSDLSADGKQINVPLVDILNAAGKGTGTLVGNEEGIDNYGCGIWADWLRHAVAFDKATNKDNALNFKTIGVPLLNQWYKKRLKEETIDALLSIPTNAVPTGFRGTAGSRINGIKWSDATAANKNACHGQLRPRCVRLCVVELLDHVRNGSGQRRYDQRPHVGKRRIVDEARRHVHDFEQDHPRYRG